MDLILMLREKDGQPIIVTGTQELAIYHDMTIRTLTNCICAECLLGFTFTSEYDKQSRSQVAIYYSQGYPQNPGHIVGHINDKGHASGSYSIVGSAEGLIKPFEANFGKTGIKFIKANWFNARNFEASIYNKLWESADIAQAKAADTAREIKNQERYDKYLALIQESYTGKNIVCEGQLEQSECYECSDKTYLSELDDYLDTFGAGAKVKITLELIEPANKTDWLRGNY